MSFSPIGTDLDSYYRYVEPDQTSGMSETELIAHYIEKSPTGKPTDSQQAEIDQRFPPTQAGGAIIHIVGAARVKKRIS